MTVAIESAGRGAGVVLTRTSDTNGYAANDVVGAATGSTAALTFSKVGAGDAAVMITSVSLQIDASAVISGETSYDLHLYSITPPSALGDNVAWDLPAGDRPYYLGKISLGTPVDVGSTLRVDTDQVNKQVKLVDENLYGYLVTVGNHTPTSARVYRVKINTIIL